MRGLVQGAKRRALAEMVVDRVFEVRAFVDAHREFHAWRRQASGSAGRTPPWSEDGTGMESRNG